MSLKSFCTTHESRAASSGRRRAGDVHARREDRQLVARPDAERLQLVAGHRAHRDADVRMFAALLRSDHHFLEDAVVGGCGWQRGGQQSERDCAFQAARRLHRVPYASMTQRYGSQAAPRADTRQTECMSIVLWVSGGCQARSDAVACGQRNSSRAIPVHASCFDRRWCGASARRRLDP
jgi:hypothetical protein